MHERALAAAIAFTFFNCSDPASPNLRPSLTPPVVAPATVFPTTVAIDPSDPCMQLPTGAWPSPIDLSRLGAFDETTDVSPNQPYGIASSAPDDPPTDVDTSVCTNPSPPVFDPTREACVITRSYAFGTPVTTARTFDTSGHLVKEVTDGGSHVKEYDPDGNLWRDANYDGAYGLDVHLRIEDPLGRLVREEDRQFDGAGRASLVDGTETFYDCHGNVAFRDRYDSEPGPKGTEARYATATKGRNDAWRKVTADGDPHVAGGWDIRYASGALKAAHTDTGWCYPLSAADESYDACGRLVQKTWTDCMANAGATWTYRSDGRLDNDYSYGELQWTSKQYSYDSRGRLVTVDETDHFCTKLGCGPNPFWYVTTTYHYDAAGDLRWIEDTDGKEWDATYDGQHRRLAETVGAMTITYQYGDCLASP